MVSIIIIVIACDRYRCIVLRNQATQMGGVAAILVLPVSLVLASLVSLPLYLRTSLVKEEKINAILEMTNRNKNETRPTRIVTMCMEQWPTGKNIDNNEHQYRVVYTILLSIL